MMKKLIFFYFLLHLSLALLHNSTEDFQIKIRSNYDSRCKEFLKFVKYGYKVLLFDFFEALINLKVENFKNFGLIDLTCIEKFQKTINSIGLIPSFSSGLIIDQKFKLNFNTDILSNYLTIKLANLHGFELNEDIFNVKINNKSIDQYISLMIYYSNFKFFINGIENENFCQKTNLYNSKKFQVFKSVSDFSIGLNVKLSTKICPYIFKNSSIKKLSIIGLSDKIFYRNIFGFQKNVLDKNDSVYFDIEKLSLELYGGDLSERLLDKIVFKKLKSIKISGQVDKIESDAFDFADGSYYLSNVDIKSKNLNILLMNSMDWLEKLYFILDKKNVTWIFMIPDLYQFPSQDFCLFKKFPKINDFRIIFSESNFNCSCTIFWLMRGRLARDPQDNYVKFLCDNIEDLKKCDIESLLSLCNNKNVFTKNNFKNDYIDLIEKSKMMKLFSISLLPIFGILGIFTNIMNMIVLNFKKTPEIAKEFNKPLFRFMFYNSILNFLYCSISLMHMSNVCLSFTSFLCSPVSKTKFVQNFEIYVVDFLGNIVKTSSNITSIAISLNRYILLENESSVSKLLNRIQNNKNFKFISFFAMTLFLILANIDKIFTSFVNEFYFYSNIYEYMESPVKNTFENTINIESMYVLKEANTFSSDNYIFLILFIINFVSNDLVLLGLLFVTDFMLLIKYRKKIKLKLKLERNRNFIKNKQSFKMEILELKITATILINSLVLFIFRSFEFSLSFFIFWNKITKNNVCLILNSICTNLIQLGNIFFLISCSFSLVVFYYLNSLFQSVLILLRKLLVFRLKQIFNLKN